MIIRHQRPTSSASDAALSAHYDFAMIADFLCAGPKRAVLIQMPAALLPHSLDVRRAMDAALRTAEHPDPSALFVAFLADNSCGSSAEIPACCCIEGRVASLLEKRDLDGILHFGPACSIVFSLPVYASAGACACRPADTLDSRSIPILYVPRRVRLPKALANADGCNAYVRCARAEVTQFLDTLRSESEHPRQTLGFVFGESVAQYLIPLVRMLCELREALLKRKVHLPYAVHGASENPEADFLAFAQNLISGVPQQPHALETTAIGLLPVTLRATTYFVFTLHDDECEKPAPQPDMAVHAMALLCSRSPGISRSDPVVYRSNACVALRTGEPVAPSVVHAPDFVHKRIRQRPYLTQAFAESPVVGLFILNNTVHTDSRNGLNNSVLLCKVLRQYLTQLCGKKVYEFYFSSASSSSIVDSEAGVANCSVANESPAAAFLTKFSHFLPQLSMGIIITDCVYKIMDIVQCCVQKTYPIPIMTALEAITAMRAMEELSLPSPRKSAADANVHPLMPRTLHWDNSYANFLLEAAGLPKQPSAFAEGDAHPVTADEMYRSVLQHVPAYVHDPDVLSPVFSPSGHALAQLFAMTVSCKARELSKERGLAQAYTHTPPVPEGQLLKSGNALTRPSENPSHFALAKNAFSVLASTDRSYQGLNIDPALDPHSEVQPEIRMGKVGRPEAYTDVRKD